MYFPNKQIRLIYWLLAGWVHTIIHGCTDRPSGDCYSHVGQRSRPHYNHYCMYSICSHKHRHIQKKIYVYQFTPTKTFWLKATYLCIRKFEINHLQNWKKTGVLYLHFGAHHTKKANIQKCCGVVIWCMWKDGISMTNMKINSLCFNDMWCVFVTNYGNWNWGIIYMQALHICYQMTFIYMYNDIIIRFWFLYSFTIYFCNEIFNLLWSQLTW